MSDQDLVFIYDEDDEEVKSYYLIKENHPLYTILVDGEVTVVSADENIIGKSDLEVLRENSSRIFKDIEKINNELKLLEERD